MPINNSATTVVCAMGGEFSLHLRLWYKLVVVNFIFHHHYFLTNNYSCDQAALVCSKFVCGFLIFTVADVYSHIIDEDRRYNAQKFEEQFYNAKGLKNAEEGKTAPMPKFETSVELLDPMAEVQKESEVEKEKPAENSTDENAALLTKLLSNPETAALLKALAKTI